MKLRGVFIALFLVPLAWGAIALLRAGAAHGIPDCPGLPMDEVGEDHPGQLMGRGDTCALGYNLNGGDSTGTATYDQLKYAQKVKRRDLLGEGLLYTLYGTAGMAATVIATRPRH
ncbi:hypothetical protein ABT275_05985 [Streptomyces sp. NPDC001185]|uniref:hypothetical protein n=1 Tax=Streptomyces sp. NPDC001185 TaxID=3154380 RepID=UPI0033200897